MNPETKAELAQSQTKIRIGEILVMEGLLTEAQIEEALAVKRQGGDKVPLGEVCISLKLITRNDLRRILRKHQANIQLGELLVNMTLITQEQLEEALTHQSVLETKLGKTLIELGYLTEADLVDAVSIQLGYPKILPSMAIIDRTLLKGLSSSYLKKNNFLPAFKEENTVTVITSDPLDSQLMELLRTHFDCQIEIAVATSEEISRTIDMYFKGVEFGSNKDSKDLIIGDVRLTGRGDDSIVEVVNFIVTNAILEEASDIHIEPMESKVRVRYRIDGILQHKTDLPKSMSTTLSSRIKILCKLDIAERRRHQDGRIQARVLNKEVDLRVSTYASLWGESIVIRILPRSNSLIDLSVLGFTPYHLSMFQHLLDMPSGIILVTGPTGSGKTTTLYSAVNYLQDKNLKVITAEDPVEYSIDGVIQGQLETKLKHTYEDFLRSMLRQDPDILMIGEIRDRVAAAAVVEAALTGHKVLTTFHTDDTTGALLRLMDMGIETFLISSTVVSVIAQRLLRTLCVKCKRERKPDEALLAQFKLLDLVEIDKYTFYEAVGCHYCRYTGYKGRTAIHELLRVNDAVRDEILIRSMSQRIRVTAREKGGLVSMREDGFYKAMKGLTTLEEILRVSVYNEADEKVKRTLQELEALCETSI